MHARVVVYAFKLKPGTIDELTAKIVAGLAPIYRNQAGFRSYEIITTGPDSGISISMWDSEAQAKEAFEVGADWVKGNVANDVVSAEANVGSVVFSHHA